MKVIEAGKKALAQSHQNQRRGPGLKNLGPSAVRKPNPASEVRSLGGKNLKGPDKGAGGS
ncbi:MAG: hypothetical protein KAJ19_14090 [Gammaproteobacteria bacterium]|nr:hypothetical protein [Gammaproteobacteria bacterium]